MSRENGEIFPASTGEDFAVIAHLARLIWRAHYPSIIGVKQTEYMLARMYHPDELQRQYELGVHFDLVKICASRDNTNEIEDINLQYTDPIAFSAYARVQSNEENFIFLNDVKLHKLYVHPNFHNQGWGRALLQRAVTFALDINAKSVALTVNKLNNSAIAAYRSYGFSRRGELITDIGGGYVMDDDVMALAVHSPR